jgi:hypothetical protein
LSDGPLLVTACLDGQAWLWKVPRPVEGDPARLRVWAKAFTRHVERLVAPSAQLPEAECQGWEKLWADVADLLGRAADRPPQPRDGDKKP